MLALRIIATVLLGISCVMTLPNKICIYKDMKHSDRDIIITTLISLLWRAFVIVVIWLK